MNKQREIPTLTFTACGGGGDFLLEDGNNLPAKCQAYKEMLV